MIENFVQIGEKVDLYLGKGPYYRTIIDDIDENNMVLASIPTFRGISIILRKGQKLKLFFYRNNGRFSIDVLVDGFLLESTLRQVRMKVLSKPVRQQRRQSFRVSTMLRTVLRPFELGPFPSRPDPNEIAQMEDAPAYNISATGVAVRTVNENYRVGDKMYLQIFLSWPKPDSAPMTVLGEVRQVARLEYGKDVFHLGIMFLDATADMSDHIARFVLVEEQRRLKQQKHI